MGYFIGFCLLVGLFYYLDKKQKAKQEKSMRNAIVTSSSDFSSTQTMVSYNKSTLVAIDENKKLIRLVTHNNISPVASTISFSDLISAEIIEDGVTVSRTSRGGQLAGAAVGGVLLGGVGAIIGGLSASQKTSEKITNMDLKLVINNTSSPEFKLNISNLPMPKNGILYKTTMEQASKWLSTFQVIINQSNKQQTGQALSMADELSKLADLKDRGTISQEEFDKAKQRILDN